MDQIVSHPESAKLHKSGGQQAVNSRQEAQPKADPPLAEAGRLQQAVSREQGAKRKRKGLSDED